MERWCCCLVPSFLSLNRYLITKCRRARKKITISWVILDTNYGARTHTHPHTLLGECFYWTYTWLVWYDQEVCVGPTEGKLWICGGNSRRSEAWLRASSGHRQSWPPAGRTPPRIVYGSVCWVCPEERVFQSRQTPWQRSVPRNRTRPGPTFLSLFSSCEVVKQKDDKGKKNTGEALCAPRWFRFYLRILLRVRRMWGNFSLKVSFMSFLRSEGLTYSMTVVWQKRSKKKTPMSNRVICCCNCCPEKFTVPLSLTESGGGIWEHLCREP